LSPILSNVYSEYHTYEALEEFGDFIVGAKVICAVKYKDELLLIAKKERFCRTYLKDELKVGRYYGMKMNVERKLC
jgi:hypothetical protein